MTTRRKTVQLGRDLLSVTLWDDESGTVARLDIADGATVGRDELAQVLEALAAFARTGELGALPAGARVVGG